MSLDIQVQILSVDTGNFYSNKEARLHWKNHKLRAERNRLVNGGDIISANGKTKRTIVGLKQIESKINECGVSISELEEAAKDEGGCGFVKFGENQDVLFKLYDNYSLLKYLISVKNKSIKKTKDDLLKLLENKINANIQSGGTHHTRALRENQVSDKNIISVFDSSFTRMIGAKQDELCEDFMVVQVYYFDVIKDLIYYGFTYKGEKYIYFTSSAGQIRTKKTVFIKESVWNQYEKTIMCGLTIDAINQKGGNNPNKHLAYMALANSATDLWNEFDIDKTIVIDDFETDVFGTYDLVDDTDYSIKRMSDYVPISHTDGAGMMLPCMGKNRMVRLPWVKGLLGSFDYVKFINENNCSPIIKDIYGQEHNVIEEDIQIIFTKSQFKMWKYYDSWKQYKEYYKKYGCTAGYTNLEEDKIKDATINYQMLQTLTDITDEEIDTIIDKSNSKLNNLCSSIASMKSAFGITPYNDNMTHLQQAINLYPDLMNDEYIKVTLREIKNSMVKRFKSGSLAVNGKYTFILPDFYAACEYWFMNVENPKGLLDDGEVFCWLFRKYNKLDCLRSPHLYKEHAVRINTACNNNKERQSEIRKWFTTDAIYTSCRDLISKILQFDVDGDKSLVVADETIVPIAEKNMNNIVPLYYNMKKASPIQLNNQTIYDGLNAAFVGGNIGIYSNNISKIWNSDVFISGTEEEKQEAVDIIKLLCMENNFVIDYAKTLYKPERPKEINEKIAAFTKGNVPHFFTYAKDKTDSQVEDANESFVNKLDYKIVNPKINSRSIGLKPIDYKMMVSNPKIKCDVVFDKNGKINEELSDPMIVKYFELNNRYHFKVNMECADMLRGELLNNSQLKQDLFFKRIAIEIKTELSQFGRTDSEIADILVKLLYYVKPSSHKSVLWFCYGGHIVENIKKHIKQSIKTIQCIDCGEWFEVGIKDTKSCRCNNCQLEYDRYRKRLWKQQQKLKVDAAN
jgi:Zn finger protein HypA/HybF involved in hydrogenase expression